jgi:hypothetical protein
MPTPFEDQVFQFILKRRPLKLVAVVLAALSIGKVMLDSAMPLYERLSPRIQKLFPQSFTPSDLIKFRCLASVSENVRRFEDLHQASYSDIKEARIKPELESLHRHQLTLQRCFRVLGYPESIGFVNVTVSRAQLSSELSRVKLDLSQSVSRFEGHLASNDVVAYRFLILDRLVAQITRQHVFGYLGVRMTRRTRRSSYKH